MEAEPTEIALRFIKEHGIDEKYLDTLSQLIEDQISKIKANANTYPS